MIVGTDQCQSKPKTSPPMSDLPPFPSFSLSYLKLPFSPLLVSPVNITHLKFKQHNRQNRINISWTTVEALKSAL